MPLPAFRLLHQLICMLGLLLLSATGLPALGLGESPLPLQALSLRNNWHKMDVPNQLEIWSQHAYADDEVWVGTMSGIARYDGVTWKEFPLPQGSDKGPVKVVHRARSGKVFVLTSSGLQVLSDGHWSSLGNGIRSTYAKASIHEARNGDVWIGHDSGFAVLRVNGRFLNIQTGESVVSFCEDASGHLWWVEGEWRKVFRAREDSDEIERPTTWEAMLPAYTEPVRYAFLQATPDGRVWLGTIKRNDPLRYYDPILHRWVDKDLIPGYGSNTIFDMTQDAQGRLWICTAPAMLIVSGDSVQSVSPSGSQVTGGVAQVCITRENTLWLSQTPSRLVRLDLKGGPLSLHTRLKYETEAFGSRWFIDEEGEIISQSLGNPNAKPILHRARGAISHPIGIHLTRAGELWAVGTEGNAAAVSLYDGTNWEKYSFPDFATGIDFDAFCEGPDGHLFLGSGQFGDIPPLRVGGVLELYRENRELRHRIWAHAADADSFPDRIHKIVQMPNGDFFTGGSKLVRLRKGITSNQDRSLEGENVWISSLQVDQEGTLWGSSFGRGIFRSKGEDFEWFRAYERGLNDTNVLDLAVLKNGTVVALTTTSLYCFDGLRWVETLQLPLTQPLPEGGAALRVAPDGALWINLVNPAWYFRWSQGSEYAATHHPVYSCLRYQPSEKGPVAAILSPRTDNPDSRAYQGSIEAWDPLSATPRRFLQYSYRLDGGPWSPFSESNDLIIQKVTDGRHTIEARARDLDFNIGPTSQPVSWTVHTPLWQRSWFYPMLVVFAFAGICIYVMNIRHHARHVLELEQQKLNFFTNLSHEIRTPLALVIAPLERVLKLCTQVELNEYLVQAHRSSNELRRIVDQLLEFRRAQSGVMQCVPENTELVVFLSDLVKSFGIIAAERHQQVVFASELTELACMADVPKLHSILNNLILNGLKYSPEKSTITVRLAVQEKDRTCAVIAVEDQGIGMDANLQKIAFTPFTRGKHERVGSVKGTGIGLSYVKELTDICQGTVEILSPLHPSDRSCPGTRVSITLPIERIPASALQNASSEGTLPEGDQEDDLPLVMLVEDDRELGRFICKELQREYRVLWESDSSLALAKARETIPDLIITDRMMPRVDGFELCRGLRAEMVTAHIPILMLTAASSRSNELEALRLGVNEFLGKPFSVELLHQKLANQLQVRDRLRAKMKREIEEAQDQKEAERIEDPFLQRANEIVDKNLQDFMFDTDSLASKLGMSRSSLYRKMQATMDLSPPVFIRTQRMRRAGVMLMGTSLGVAQVMEAVGITEQRTFNKWFRSFHGCTPSDFRTRNSRRKDAPHEADEDRD